VAAQEEIGHQWTLTDLDNFEREDAGRDARATVEFLKSGNYQLEGLAFAGEGANLTQDNVIWTIQVRSAILDFLPHSLNLSVSRGATITFELIPFNPASDSLRNQWLLDGEAWDVDSLRVAIPFSQEVTHTVQGILMDGEDAEDGDTIIWRINVFPPDAVKLRMQNLEFRMMELAPNPFNSSTTIRFSTPLKLGGTEVAVYDLSGKLVKRLFEGRVEAGEHSVVFYGEGLAAGIYLIRLEAGGNIAVRKALFLR